MKIRPNTVHLATSDTSTITPNMPGTMPSSYMDYAEIHPEPSTVRMVTEGEEAKDQEMSESDLSSLSSIDSTPRQKPHLEIIPATSIGSLAAHSEQVRGALAQRFQQALSSSRVVETQLEGGLSLTPKNRNTEEPMEEEERNWDSSDDEEMQSPTALAYERKASGNTKPRQPMKFPTTPRRPRAGPNWHSQSEDRSDHGQKEKIEELIGKVNNLRQWQEKQIGMAEAEKDQWKALEGWAADRVTAETRANEHRQVMSSWKMAMDARYIETKGQMKEMNDKLNRIQAFCGTFTGENEKPDEEKMNQMADMLCGRMCSFFEAKQKEIDNREKKNSARKREVVRREVQEALGITDMEIETNEDQRVRVEEQVEKALEMEIDRQGLENSKHAPTIMPGGTKPEPVAAKAQAPAPPAVPRMIQLKGKAQPTLITPPKAQGSKALENAPKGPKAEQKKGGGAKEGKEPPKALAPPQQQQAKKPEIGKATYAENLATLIAGQNKKDEVGFQVVGRKKEKKEEKKEVSGLEPIPTNKNMLENRRVTFSRNNGVQFSRKKDAEIVSEVNRALWARQVPAHIRMIRMLTNMRGSIKALARENTSADMLIAFREIIVTAARKVDQGIIDIEKNETWERVKMHGINFDQYMAKRSGGLKKLREEIHAENEGVIIPMAIRWMGRVADMKDKKKNGEKQASSVVLLSRGRRWLSDA
jgi:hypothetical protein